ncbi:MAG: sulfatase-like hydrolase/transferase [Pseudomonadota bacterium]
MRDLGYGTSLVGKWHLGNSPEHGPLRHGYERFFGILGAGADCFTHEFRVPPTGKSDLRDGEVPVTRDGCLPDILATRAIEDIAHFADSARPFFISLHFTAPHWPWEGPEDRHYTDDVGSAGVKSTGLAERY